MCVVGVGELGSWEVGSSLPYSLTVRSALLSDGHHEPNRVLLLPTRQRAFAISAARLVATRQAWRGHGSCHHVIACCRSPVT